ncbi:TolB family protein, partial [Candidatus Latescibacterota bacterium]
QTRLTDNPKDDISPSWSPDSYQIVFTSYRDNHKEIYVMNADGSNQTRLTDNPKDDISPSWSPF